MSIFFAGLIVFPSVIALRIAGAMPAANSEALTRRPLYSSLRLNLREPTYARDSPLLNFLA